MMACDATVQLQWPPPRPRPLCPPFLFECQSVQRPNLDRDGPCCSHLSPAKLASVQLYYLSSKWRSGKEREYASLRVYDDKGAPTRLKSKPFKIGLEKLDSGNEIVEGGVEESLRHRAESEWTYQGGNSFCQDFGFGF